MDWIFGTHVHEKEMPESYGLRESFPRTYWGQIFGKDLKWPF